MATLNTLNHIAGEENSWPERPWGEDAGEEHVCLQGMGTPLVSSGMSGKGCLSMAVCPCVSIWVQFSCRAWPGSGLGQHLASCHFRGDESLGSFHFFHTAHGLEGSCKQSP